MGPDRARGVNISFRAGIGRKNRRRQGGSSAARAAHGRSKLRQTRGNLPIRKKSKQICKKGLTESDPHLRGRFTGRERRFKRLERPGRQHRRTPSPPIQKMGEQWLSA